MSKKDHITVLDSLLCKGEYYAKVKSIFFDQNSIVRGGIDLKLADRPREAFWKVLRAFSVLWGLRVGLNLNVKKLVT